MSKIENKSYNDMILDIEPESRTVKACWSRIGNVDLDNDIIVAEHGTSHYITFIQQENLDKSIFHKCLLTKYLRSPIKFNSIQFNSTKVGIS